MAALDCPAGSLVLVACSGGADSLALAHALSYCAKRASLRAGLLTVDHGLQAGSAERAAGVRDWALSAGFSVAEVLTVSVGSSGGPEAAARAARYAALDAAAERLGAAAVLLGHTREDQAETVLLGLARGSGIRAAAGMPARRGRYLRPLLDVPRATTAAFCAAAGLTPWCDPHNSDPAYARSRLRALLPALEEAAPGLVVGLARTARMARADADVLDDLAADVSRRAVTPDGLDVDVVAAQPAAIRTRVLHLWASGAVSSFDLTSLHITALEALVTAYRGQGPVSLPGGIRATRTGRTLRLVAP
ncbi:tRNA lysidine(34) synthetase TilS [Fodinicola acaciae]|uniref:tRNA lysidine(34) synthetase TilS n=1 Tax=Fodinicola acaciae TaxID=2681555 RepID=UPI001C9E3AD4|nr:tRNA lysidine(34) synthetase TilS [Fodinicola acaciae]